MAASYEVKTIRFQAHDRQAIQQDADTLGITFTEFIRQAIREKQAGLREKAKP